METKVKASDLPLEELKFQKVTKLNGEAISRNREEAERLQNKIKQIKMVLTLLNEEVVTLKNELQGKERRLTELVDERRKLVKNFQMTKCEFGPLETERSHLEVYYMKQKETLRLMNFENGLKDREIAVLEKRVDSYLEEQTLKSAASQAKEETSGKKYWILESSLSPKAFAKLQKHASRYGYQHRQKERSRSVR